MIQGLFPVVHVREVARNIHVLRFVSPEISSQVRPGQFLNIRVADGFGKPLLRRPFSVYRTEGEAIEIIFNVVGRGTLLHSRKHSGEHLDILGPLGVPFRVDGQEFQTGILVGGGLGVAPLPITTAALRAGGKRIHTYLGGRSKDQVVAFLRSIPQRLSETIRTVCCDMYAGYTEAVREELPQAQFVVDRFHVTRHYHQAADQVRHSSLSQGCG